MRTVPPPERSGWATIECILLSFSLDRVQLVEIVTAVRSSGFELRSDGLVAREGGDFVPVDASLPVDPFLAKLSGNAVNKIIANFHGKICDVGVDLSVLMDLDNSVVVVDVPENILLGMSNDLARPEFRHFEKFTGVCKAIASALRPSMVTICSEQYSSLDFKEHGATSIGLEAYNEAFFAREHLLTIFAEALRCMPVAEADVRRALAEAKVN
jgi:hypothetical protein